MYRPELGTLIGIVTDVADELDEIIFALGMWGFIGQEQVDALEAELDRLEEVRGE